VITDRADVRTRIHANTAARLFRTPRGYEAFKHDVMPGLIVIWFGNPVGRNARLEVGIQLAKDSTIEGVLH